MAINILREPERFTPAFNPNVWVVESGNATECEFQYICDVYQGATKIARLKTFPDADGVGIFKVQDVVASVLGITLRSSIAGFQYLTDHVFGYNLKFGEEYDASVLCDAGTTIYAGTLSTGTYYTWLSAFSQKDFITYTDDTFELVANFAGRFLTNLPSNSLVMDYQELAFLNQASLTSAKLWIKTYDFSGNLIQTAKITTGLNTSIRLQSIGVGPENLNAATLSTGAQPVVDSAVKYYTVQMYTSANLFCSELKTFTVDRRCTRFEGRTVKFLNRLGAWDVFHFTADEKVTVPIRERKEYSKLTGQYTQGSPTGTWGYKTSDRGRATYAVNATQATILTSHFVDEDTAIWLLELFTSPEVYIVDDAGDEVPIIVTSNVYERKLQRQIKLKQYTFEYQLAHDENIQRL